MKVKILNVAYPFAPAGPHAVGGAEQVLSQLDGAVTEAGLHSYVVGCHGSLSAGHLIEAFPIPKAIEEGWKEYAHEQYRACIERTIDDHRIDLVHLHGVDFYKYMPRRDLPILATLHLPVSWYPQEAFESGAWLNCVSPSQHNGCRPSARLLPPIENGVAVPPLRPRRPSGFVLSLGRICPEKGFHLAMDAARSAGVAFALAGEVFRHETHLSYYESEIRVRESPQCRYIGPISGMRKWRYLQKARCLLVPSLAPETSSLVTMEALACGTPVIAFARGALPDLIEDGRTGFLVQSVDEMAEAIQRVDTLDRERCRAAARIRFTAAAMTSRYLERYLQLIGQFTLERNLACA